MLVSIIVPFYNREKYLYETLHSIQNQTYKKIQVILVDDCSTDSSFLIAKSFVDNDDRFILIKNKFKQRQGKAKNQAIEYILQSSKHQYATSIFGSLQPDSKWIFFLDSDDILDKDAIEHLTNIAKDNNINLTIGSTQIFGEYSKNIIYKEGLANKNEILNKQVYFSFGWGGADIN